MCIFMGDIGFLVIGIIVLVFVFEFIEFNAGLLVVDFWCIEVVVVVVMMLISIFLFDIFCVFVI